MGNRPAQLDALPVGRDPAPGRVPQPQPDHAGHHALHHRPQSEGAGRLLVRQLLGARPADHHRQLQPLAATVPRRVGVIILSSIFF